jgi:hypothetical protein
VVHNYADYAKLSGDESVIQMVTRPALNALDKFNTVPTRENALALVDIPAIHGVLDHEFRTNGHVSVSMLRLCTQLHQRAAEVLSQLIVHPSPPVLPPSLTSNLGEEWHSVCVLLLCCFEV